MSIKIKIVSNDFVKESKLIAEHGLSYYLETPHKKILFDSGQGLVIEHNLKILKIDPSQIDIFALSHGHYDHSDGFAKILKHMKNKKFYTHKNSFIKRYTENNRYIGITEKLSEENLKKNNTEIKYTEKITKLTENIYMTGEIPRNEETEKITNFKTPDGKNDIIIDDQTLYIETPKGIVILLGCTHSGLINTINYIKSNTNQKIRAILGGTHLYNATQEKLLKTANCLNSINPENYYLGHCTGINTFSYLKTKLNAPCEFLKCGDEFEF